MTYLRSYKGLLSYYDTELDDGIRKYFSCLPVLLKQEEIPLEVVLAYLFLKIEQAQNRCLYGGIVKIHRAEVNFASRIINQQHLTRDGFQKLYKNIFGTSLSSEAIGAIKEAENVRDQVIHGKDVKIDKLRYAIVSCLKYAKLVNSEISSMQEAGFKPFGDMRGFKGRGESLDKRTTKWLMKGLGFEARS